MTQPEKRLYLLDGMALIYRAHFALIRSPRFTSGGLATSAVFGLTNVVFDLLKRENPTHLGVVFDTADPTERHRIFPEYKAQRDALPEDIEAQFPYADRLFEALKIPVIRMPGYEADDIIATLARQAENDGFRVWMVTPDKDYHQLVTENTVVYRPGRQGSQHEILGVPEVLDKWQIQRVDQVIDILGLMGDSSDNIPGIPGVGEKTAQKLIAKFDNIENLLQHTGELKGKQKERVEENADKALLSKQLVTIMTDVPVAVELSQLEVEPPDETALRTLFDELEFNTLTKRLLGDVSPEQTSAESKPPSPSEKDGGPAPAWNESADRVSESPRSDSRSLFAAEPTPLRRLDDVPHSYHIVRTAEERTDLIRRLKSEKRFCFDLETTGLDPRTAAPLGMACTGSPGKAWYVVLPDDADAATQVLEEFHELFTDASVTRIGHNLKYDLTVLRQRGIRVATPIFDSMLVHSLVDPESRHGMDYLAETLLGYETIPISRLIGERVKGRKQKSMADVPLEQLAEYACEDADITLQIADALRPMMTERGLDRVCLEVECPLIPVLVEMEHEGIRMNAEALHDYSERLQEEIDQLKLDIFEAAGHGFNIDSPKQLGVVLFDELQLSKKPRKTATGQYSTREAELLKLASSHRIVQQVLDYRNAAKLKSVYVDQLPQSINPETGRVHTHYSQVWTATGRMQSDNPNLQTIPVRKERGREIRAAFEARDENHLLLAADYSQIELRIMADFSHDEAMLEAFRNDTDIHRVTASKVYGVPEEDVTREMRDKAKMVNFGIIYGISAFGLQQRLNIAKAEAEELISGYFRTFPGVREWIDNTVRTAEEQGFVTTVTGRRRYLKDINSRNKSLKNAAERLAMNSPIQGTAADMLKLAMIRVHRALNEGDFSTRMLLTVHDELVFDMPKSEQADVMPVIEDCMKNALPMTVPIRVEMGTGANWLEAH